MTTCAISIFLHWCIGLYFLFISFAFIFVTHACMIIPCAWWIDVNAFIEKNNICQTYRSDPRLHDFDTHKRNISIYTSFPPLLSSIFFSFPFFFLSLYYNISKIRHGWFLLPLSSCLILCLLYEIIGVSRKRKEKW